MKALNTVYQEQKREKVAGGWRWWSLPVKRIRASLALLGATTIAAGLVILSIWATGLESAPILSALSWGLGYVFLAMAVDNRASTAFLQLFSGIALIVLALFQSMVSVDFLMGSGLLIAGWVAVLSYRQLR
mgnify:CR=1 FL=1